MAEESDPAYAELLRLKDRLSKNSKAREVKILVAGQGKSCSHNLLYCYERIGNDIDVIAFADSDICVKSNWLSHLVYPLRQSKNGAVSGYRWFVPEKNNTASLALSALNAKVAQLLGNTRFNQAWGGSMAIRTDIFRQLGLDKIWPKTLSDDLSLSRAVKKAGMKVAFVPACLVASYESTNWQKLFEFARRQFLITRLAAPGTWLFGSFSSIYSVLGLWGGILIASPVIHNSWFDKQFTSQGKNHLAGSTHYVSWKPNYQSNIAADNDSKAVGKRPAQNENCMSGRYSLFLGWSLILLFFILSSAFGNTVCWQGIRYKLLGPTETVVLDG